MQIFFYFLAHIFLAQAMRMAQPVSMIHGLTTLIVCIFMAFNRKHPEKTAYALAYIAGSEVLWRMTKMRLLWEYGKYAIVAVCIASILCRGSKKIGLPLIYFLCLIPAVFILPFNTMDSFQIRSDVSFALSGPLSLALSVMCLSKIRLDTKQLQTMLLALSGPIVGVGSIAAFSSYSAREMHKYASDSSWVGSGGFGPNQVSAVLGFGAMAVFFYILLNKDNRFARFVLIPTGFLLATQCALTFSRGGLYCAAGGAVFIIQQMIRDKKTRNKIYLSVFLIALAANFIALPALVKFTGGAIVERFKDTSQSGRESIFRDDIDVFLKNPIFGVGPGQAQYHRERFGEQIISHSEFSRALAEHGMFGLISLAIMMILGMGAYRKAKSPIAKALVSSMIVWALLHMYVYASRTALPSLAFGFAFITILRPMRPMNSNLKVPETIETPPPLSA